MLVTVAICTWNRAKLLDQTLAEMQKLVIPEGVEWELIVVNNNCTDSTDNVIEQYSDHLPIIRVCESKPGQSNARNAAIARAHGDLVLWTDDDVLVDKEWIAEFVKASNSFPEYSFFGGAVQPWFTSSPPGWLQRHIGEIPSPFALKDHGRAIRPFCKFEEPVGASMAVRGDVQRSHLFDASLGHTKNNRQGGDEKDLFRRLESAGHKGLWVGTAIVKHYMHPDRLSPRYVRNWFAAVAKNDASRMPAKRTRTVLGIPRWLLREYCTSWLQEVAHSFDRDEKWLRATIRRGQVAGMISASRDAYFKSQSDRYKRRGR